MKIHLLRLIAITLLVGPTIAFAQTFLMSEYFPLESGDEWIYEKNGSSLTATTVLEGTFPINGVLTKARRDTDGHLEYFTNDASGIRFHQEIETGENLTFSPPVTIVPASVSTGQTIGHTGVATLIQNGGNTSTLGYVSSTQVIGIETVTVPAGTFDALKLQWTTTLSGNVNGSPISVTIDDNIWLVRYTGVVKIQDLVDFETDALVSTNVSPPPPSLAAAVLPSGRSVEIGNTATAFATIINVGSATATTCGISPLTSVPANFSYQTTDPATNALVGTPNTPVDILAGGLQTYLFAFTPIGAFVPTDVELAFDCTNSDPASVVPGLNTLLLSSSSTPVPDIVALSATPTGDGIVSLPGNVGANAFAVATVNVGSQDTITATADTGTVPLPVTLSICESVPATGTCLAQPAFSVATAINAGATPTFSIFVMGNGTVPFDPANNRVFVRFWDSGGVPRGSTSVAVRTQ